jgi:large subunit ribosomal protein L35
MARIKRGVTTRAKHKRIRRLRGEAQVHASDVKEVRKLLPNS